LSGAAKVSLSRQALLETAITMLGERGPDGFTVDQVLVDSGASSSSLYHHFGSRQGLLAAAQGEIYLRFALGEDRRNLVPGLDATTAEDFLRYIAEQLERAVTEPENRVVRRARLLSAALSLSSVELAAQTLVVQEAMFDAIAAVLDDASARGLINPELDARAYCAWFHGMIIGRTVTEAGSVEAQAWLGVAVPAALAPLRLPRQD